MQTQNYEEARRYFLNNAQHGWKYIESFIVSEKMLERLLQDDLPGGSVIQLQANSIDQRTNIRIKGYPIIVSSGYTQLFGVTYIMYEDKFSAEVMELLRKNRSRSFDNIK